MDSVHRPAAEVVVVMLPFVAHGHLNQFAYLSRLISTYNIAVHFRTGKMFPADLQILKGLPSQDGCLSPEFQEFVKLQLGHDGFHVGTLFDSSRAIEGEYIEYLEKEEEMKNDKNKKKLWAVGPINSGQQTLVTVSENSHECLQWLDLQPPGSVIYVSFGTTTTFSDEQVKELAIGLERSQQRFVWVVRVADKGDVFVDEAKMIKLPDGFEERVLRIGLVVVDWGRRDELVTAIMVKDIIRRLIDSREGEEIRKRAVEMGDTIRRSVADGGVSRKETDLFVSYIRRPK
ncbi:hypothetical protein L6452_42527 [Arctium lappa]|uniref:Uncharacterized protein n=1 Tax=Arctium lappa TaxID=4217 RepID=A0ACB8XJ71_ARCLA|nr:hypothetical protein L6452_42527 [Arctium lappa]